jgi:hypothetical protein
MDKGKNCNYCNSLITSKDYVCSFCGYRQGGYNKGFKVFAIIIALIIISFTFWGTRQIPHEQISSTSHIVKIN